MPGPPGAKDRQQQQLPTPNTRKITGNKNRRLATGRHVISHPRYGVETQGVVIDKAGPKNDGSDPLRFLRQQQGQAENRQQRKGGAGSSLVPASGDKIV